MELSFSTVSATDSIVTAAGTAAGAGLAKKKPLLRLVSVNNNAVRDSAETYGGKASGLAKLIYYGYGVPTAWVIPCAATLTRPRVYLTELLDFYETERGHDLLGVGGLKFAVRSGAPISMPGLLNTKLYVPFEGLEDAIHEVWDSWNTPHAVAYREATGISHDIGTGVIVQEMVQDIDFAGVAFSNRPANTHTKLAFDPIIEFVKGDGESLVSGAATPTVAKAEWFVSSLKSTLRRIANNWKCAVDVEWAINTSGKLFILQARALKFAKIPPPASPKQGRKLLGMGVSVGAPTEAVGRVYHTEDAPDHLGAVVLDGFNPANYTHMLASRAILCKTGGSTCHAAIVARDLNKPALSGLSGELLDQLETGTIVLVDGHTGALYSAEESDLEAETVAVKVELPVPEKPSYIVSDWCWSASSLLFVFYKTLHQHQKGEISSEEKDKVVKQIAFVISSYMYWICCSEIRHIYRSSRSVKYPDRDAVAKELRLLGVRIPDGSESVDRSEFARLGIPAPRSLSRAVKVLEVVVKGYEGNIPWASSYGGPKWAAISKLLLSYLKAELSSTLFVDACFNLQHNSGSIFGKFTWMDGTGNLKNLLDAKANGFEQLKALADVHEASVAIQLEKAYVPSEEIEDPLLDVPALWGSGEAEEEESEEDDDDAPTIECDCPDCKESEDNEQEEEDEDDL